MAARLQGFPDTWEFCGGKTAAYRQVGNAFRPRWPGPWARRSPQHCQAIMHAAERLPAGIVSILMNTERRAATRLPIAEPYHSDRSRVLAVVISVRRPAGAPGGPAGRQW